MNLIFSCEFLITKSIPGLGASEGRASVERWWHAAARGLYAHVGDRGPGRSECDCRVHPQVQVQVCGSFSGSSFAWARGPVRVYLVATHVRVIDAGTGPTHTIWGNGRLLAATQ